MASSKFLQKLKNIPWKKILRISGKVLCTFLLTVFILSLALVTLPPLCGYPQWVARSIAKNLTPKAGSCSIGNISGGIFSEFVIEDIQLEKPTPYGKLTVVIPRATVSIQLQKLLKAQVLPKTISLERIEATLEVPPETIDGTPDTIRLRDCGFRAQLSSKGLLQADAHAELMGVKIRVNATVTDVTNSFEKEGSDKNLKNKGRLVFQDKSEPPSYDMQAIQMLRTAAGKIRQVTSNAETATCDVNLYGSANDLDHLQITGNLGLANATFLEQEISRIHGRFFYQNNNVDVDEFHVSYNAQEFADAQIHANIDAKNLEGKFNASLMPETILGFLDFPSAQFLLKYFTFTTPIRFQGEIPKCQWEAPTVNPRLSFQCNDFFLEDLRIRRAEGVITYSPEKVLLENLQVTSARKRQETLKGEFQLDLQEKLVQGNLQGSVDLPEFLRDIQLLDSRNTPLEAFNNTALEFTLQPSPVLEWQDWEWTATARQSQSSLAKFPLTDLEIVCGYQKRLLSSKLKACFNGNPDDYLVLQGQTPLPQVEDISEMTIALPVRTTLQWEGTQGWDIGGDLMLDFQEKTIDLLNGKGILRPEILYTLAKTHMEMDGTPVWDTIRCLEPEKTMQVEFYLKGLTWGHPRNSWDWQRPPWYLNGHASMEDMRILDIDFQNLEVPFYLSKKGITLTNILGILADSEDTLTGNLEFQFSPRTLLIDNLDFYGTPTNATNLLYNDTAKQVFQHSWEGFTWERQENPVHVNIEKLEFFFPQEGAWDFAMKGYLDCKDFIYEDTAFQRIHADMAIEYPNGELRVDNIVLEDKDATPEDRLLGNAAMQFKNGISGTFRLEKKGGKVRSLGILINLFSSMEESLRPFDLAPEANFTCSGRFSLGSTPSLDLQGTLETPFLKYDNILLENLQGEWAMDDYTFRWDFPEAEFHGGTLACTGLYNTRLNSFEMLTSAKGLPLAHLLALTKGKLIEEKENQDYTSERIPGTLDVDGHFIIFENWAKRPIHLEGSGSLHVEGADLWRVPTFTTLGEIIAGGSLNFFSKDKISQLGRISMLDAEFQCMGTTIEFNDIRTDGSVVALTGEGRYRLTDKQMNFTLSGQLLKSISVISFLLKPVTWAFDAQLVGTPEKHEWHLRSMLGRLFD